MPQSLYEKTQAAYDRIQISFQPKNCLPEIAAFAENIFENKVLEKDLKAIIQSSHDALTTFFKLKRQSFEEIKAAEALIAGYKEHIPTLSPFLEECNDLKKNNPPSSWWLIFLQEELIRRICIFLMFNMKWQLADNHSEKLLRQLAIVDEKGNISSYIFAPSLEQCRAEITLFERAKKGTLWYSLHMLHHILSLYDFKKRHDRYLSFIETNQHPAAYFFKVDFLKLDSILDATNNARQDFDTEEYKIYAHHVWSFIKPILLSYENPVATDEELTYRYTNANDLRKGIWRKGKITRELVGNSAEVLHLALTMENLSYDEAGENLPDTATPKKDQVTSALRVIRTNALKVFELADYITSKRGTISVNYPTRLIK